MTRVRFAPSPTGHIHLGNLRTALFNYLFAKSKEGQFILRIEDTDQERSKPEYEESIYQDLKFLGFVVNEKPGQGDCEPYRQSESLNIYQKYIEELKTKDRVYPCFCSPEELQKKREALAKANKPPRYDGTCAQLSQEEVQGKIDAGFQPSLRFRIGRGYLHFKDLVYANKKFSLTDIGDFIIVRPDGMPVYLFASAIDDARMKISHVIRGEDGLSNTPRQMALLQALELHVPEYAHLPLLLGKDKKLLSKRHGAMSIQNLNELGYLPEAIINYLVFMGWSPNNTQEFFSVDELSQVFDLSRVSRSPSVFDFDRLNYFNKHYIQNLKREDFESKIVVFLKSLSLTESDSILDIAWACRNNGKTLVEIAEVTQHIVQAPQDFSSEVRENLDSGSAGKLFQDLQKLILESSNIDFKTLLNSLKSNTGLKGKQLFMPLRVALTGQLQGPELSVVWEHLNQENRLARIDYAIKSL